MIEQNRWKMKAAVEKYRAAYKSLEALGIATAKPDGWNAALRVLNNRGLPVDGLGEGYRTLSWIRMAPGVFDSTADDDPRLHDGKTIYHT
jgi:hypothetical protein